ncbi:hypothetical protein [Aquimarina sp. RZ0]|uniref:hypothetical protein n=1 Tax=Aquimarina sp. RZ0 TaxID=2607730 RepID=UPI0011F0E4E3|nr:hypothetical protein [Aquimarina sp. RZ0]KAA1248128.1 hypothetical protein F0000_00595 [Aquimarina sp. RZ0]
MNWNSKKIWKEEIISQKFIKHLKETEVSELLEKEDIQIGVISERDTIDWLEKEENQDFWNARMQHHICENIIEDDDDFYIGCDYNDFKGAYFFVPSLWKSKDTKKIIILEYYH